MKTIQVEITGETALLMHRFPLDGAEAVDKKSTEEQAERAAYRRADNQKLFIPGINLQCALVAAAAFSKGKGRASLTKVAAAGLSVKEEELDLGTTTYTIDARSVVIPATRGRVIRYRPRLDEWKVSFTLIYDETLLRAKEVRTIVDDAGLRVGLLDFRPACKGPFGKFKVTVWLEE